MEMLFKFSHPSRLSTSFNDTVQLTGSPTTGVKLARNEEMKNQNSQKRPKAFEELKRKEKRLTRHKNHQVVEQPIHHPRNIPKVQHINLHNPSTSQSPL